MADVRIRVIADAHSAIQNIQNITDSGVKADKSLASLGKTLGEMESKQRKGEVVSGNYAKELEKVYMLTMRSANASLAAGKGLEGYVREIEKARSALFKMGATSAASSLDKPLKEATQALLKLQSQQDTSRIEKLKEQADAAERLKKQEAEINDEVERRMALAKNDPVQHMRYVYVELEKQLRANIDTQVRLTLENKKDTKYMATLKEEASALSKRMNELETSMKKASRTPLNERMSNLVKSFVSAQVVVWGLRRIFSGFTSVLKESGKAAAYAEETYNLFITTFEQVAGRADRVASSVANSLGLATSSAQKALGAFGDLMKGYGSTDAEALKFAEAAAQTALDIISFKNIAGSTDEIMQSFASGLAGNVENFRKLGYVITQAEVKTLLAKKGLDGLTGSALQQAMVQARLELVMKKANNAMGDMKKTLDSTVNVERRVNEAWLEYKENLGQDVNKVMSPLKRWWLDILETTNKANEAKEKFMKGTSTEGIYDLSDREGADWKRFRNSLGQVVSTHQKMGGYSNDQRLTNEFARVMNEFHASVDDLAEALGPKASYLTDAIKEALTTKETQRTTSENADKAWEARTSNFLAEAQKVQGYIDALSALKGAETTASASWYLNPDNAKASTKSTSNPTQWEIGGIGDMAFQQVLSSMANADWKKFLSPVELAFEKVGEKEGLQAQAKELENLYEIAYNYALQDGKLTESENADLQSIIKVRAGIIKQLEELEKVEKEREEGIDDIVTTAQGVEGFITSLRGLNGGFTSASAKMYLDPKNAGNIDKAGLNAIASSAIDDIISTMAKADWSDFVSPIEMALEDVTREGSLTSAVNELKTFYIMAYEFAMQDGEINEKEAEQLSRIVAIRKEALEQLGEEEKEALAQAQKQELTDFGIDALGDVGAIINAFSNAGASMGGWIGMLIQLAAQLDIVREIGETFSKTILPVLNQLLEPLMPTLTVLFDIIIEFLSNTLEPIYTLLKALAPLINTIAEILRPVLQMLNALTPIIDLIVKGLALIIGLINGAIKFVVDSLKWLAGWIMKGVLALVNGCIDILNMIPFVHIRRVDTSQYDQWASKNPVDSFKEGFDEVQDAINKGNGLLDDIKGNTDKTQDDKLKYLAELYKGGLLSADEYYAQRGSLTGENWDRTKFWSKGTYYNGNGNTIIRYGDVTVSIDGTNLTADQIADAFEKKTRAGANGYQMAY